jgi:hypothetical protein
MEPLNLDSLSEQALLLLDSAPIIYFLEAHPKFGTRYKPLFEAHAAGSLRFAVTTITVAEVLTGPLQSGRGDPSRSISTSRRMRRDCGLRFGSSSQTLFRSRARSPSTQRRWLRTILISHVCTPCVSFPDRPMHTPLRHRVL